MGLHAQQFGVFLHPGKLRRQKVQFVLAPEAGHDPVYFLVLKDGHDVEDELLAVDCPFLVEFGLTGHQNLFQSCLRDDVGHGFVRKTLIETEARIAPGRLVGHADIGLVVNGDDSFANGLQHGDAFQIQIGDFGRLKAQGQLFEAAGNDDGAENSDHAHADDVGERLVQVR